VNLQPSQAMGHNNEGVIHFKVCTRQRRLMEESYTYSDLQILWSRPQIKVVEASYVSARAN
jgi:hypothetical protein